MFSTLDYWECFILAKSSQESHQNATVRKSWIRKHLDHESAWGGCILEVFPYTFPSQAKRKPGEAIFEKTLQDFPCGFLLRSSADIFKANYMQKSEMCVCKGSGGRETVHSPTRYAPHRCYQVFFSHHSQDEWKIIQKVFFFKTWVCLKTEL